MPTEKKTKVEEDDDAEKKKYVSKLSKRQKKAKVDVDGDTIKCYDLDTEGVKRVMGRHDDPKDPTSLTQDALKVICSSREFHKNVHGGAGKRLAQNPKRYKDNTVVEGATQTERMINNIRMSLTNPDNGKKGVGVCSVCWYNQPLTI